MNQWGEELLIQKTLVTKNCVCLLWFTTMRKAAVFLLTADFYWSPWQWLGALLQHLYLSTNFRLLWPWVILSSDKTKWQVWLLWYVSRLWHLMMPLQDAPMVEWKSPRSVRSVRTSSRLSNWPHQQVQQLSRRAIHTRRCVQCKYQICISVNMATSLLPSRCIWLCNIGLQMASLNWMLYGGLWSSFSANDLN